MHPQCWKARTAAGAKSAHEALAQAGSCCAEESFSRTAWRREGGRDTTCMCCESIGGLGIEAPAFHLGDEELAVADNLTADLDPAQVYAAGSHGQFTAGARMANPFYNFGGRRQQF